MKLSELFLNRFLRRDYTDPSTQDAGTRSLNQVVTSNAIASGNAATDVNTGDIAITNINYSIADLGWTQTCAFSPFGSDRIDWGAGVFTSASGATYSISASNTSTRLTANALASPMNAIAYVYLDILSSITEYQVTYSQTFVLFAGRVLIAVCRPAVAPSVLATYILVQATQIVADNIIVNTLSAISADIGAITAGTIDGVVITGGILQTASSGQRVVISGVLNSISFIDSAGTDQGTMYGSSTGGIFITGTNFVSIAIGASNYMFASGSSGVMALVKDMLPIGSVQLGDFGSNYTSVWTDNLFTSSIATNGGQIDVTGGFYPLSDSLYDLGSTTYRWDKIWADAVEGGTITGSSLSVGSGTGRVGGFLYLNALNDNAWIYSTGSAIQLGNAGSEVLSSNSSRTNIQSALQINGTQVVSTRKTAITNPTGGATIDSQARTAIDAIINRLESHGLIST